MNTQPSTLTPATLPIQRIQFEVEALHPMKLPDYAGSMLRGAFGHAFRRLSCMTRQKSCDHCPLLTTCPYSLVFETPAHHQSPLLQQMTQAPKPYVIEPPGGGYRRLNSGERFGFAMVLIGTAIQQLPLILLAWEQALNRGLGSQNLACRLICAHVGNPDMPIYRPGGVIQPLPPQAATGFDWSQRQQVVLRFMTPLRLQQRGRILGSQQLDSRTLLVSLARRYQMFADALQLPQRLDFAAITQASKTITLTSRLHWQDYERYSSRQQQTTPLGGLVGELMLSGQLEAAGPLLDLGQQLHIGKETVFGLGQYQLQEHWTSIWQPLPHTDIEAVPSSQPTTCEQPS